MADWLRKGTEARVRAETDWKVRDAVESTLADIAARGWIAD